MGQEAATCIVDAWRGGSFLSLESTSNTLSTSKLVVVDNTNCGYPHNCCLVVLFVLSDARTTVDNPGILIASTCSSGSARDKLTWSIARFAIKACAVYVLHQKATPMAHTMISKARPLARIAASG